MVWPPFSFVAGGEIFFRFSDPPEPSAEAQEFLISLTASGYNLAGRGRHFSGQRHLTPLSTAGWIGADPLVPRECQYRIVHRLSGPIAQQRIARFDPRITPVGRCLSESRRVSIAGGQVIQVGDYSGSGGRRLGPKPFPLPPGGNWPGGGISSFRSGLICTMASK